MAAVQAERARRRWRRGAVNIFVAITVPVMIGFTALTVDVGYLYATRAQLQNAADAAALAGASAYFTDANLAGDTAESAQIARVRAGSTARHNRVLGRGIVLGEGDIVLGQHELDRPHDPLSAASKWNAVQVTTRRTEDSINGPVPLFFAGIFGRYRANLVATARAMGDDHASGDKGSPFIPFVIAEDLYKQFLISGGDQYGYDGGVTGGADGIREVKLFPWQESGTHGQNPIGSAGAGNFGTLNIGAGGEGTSTLTRQITEGTTPEEIEGEFGTSELSFYDAEHTADTGPRLYQVTGNPGMSGGMDSALQGRVGDVVGFFLHRGVAMSGSNAAFQISGIAFGRIMAVQIHGSPNTRALIIQPVPYASNNILTDPDAPSTHGALGRVLLVQ